MTRPSIGDLPVGSGRVMEFSFAFPTSGSPAFTSGSSVYMVGVDTVPSVAMLYVLRHSPTGGSGFTELQAVSSNTIFSNSYYDNITCLDACIDYQGVVHIVVGTYDTYPQYGGRSLAYRAFDLKTEAWLGSGWENPVYAPETSSGSHCDNGRSVAICTDQENIPHALLCLSLLPGAGAVDTSGVFYTNRQNPLHWSAPEQIHSGSDYGWDVCIEANGEDKIEAAYKSWALDDLLPLYRQTRTDTTWGTKTLVNGNAAEMSAHSILVLDDGRAEVYWGDGTYYLWCDKVKLTALRCYVLFEGCYTVFYYNGVRYIVYGSYPSPYHIYCRVNSSYSGSSGWSAALDTGPDGYQGISSAWCNPKGVFVLDRLDYSINGYWDFLPLADRVNDHVPAYIRGRLDGATSIHAYLNSGTWVATSVHAYMNCTDEQIPPVEDISSGSSAGAWENETSGSVLYPSLADASYSTYAWYQKAMPGDYFEVKLQSVEATVLGSHTLRWIGWRKAGTQATTIKAELKDGNAVICSDVETITDNAYHEFFHKLTSGEIGAISSYMNLRIRITVLSVV